MKTLIFRFSFLSSLSLIHSPLAVAHESPSSADSVHFREHRPAAKRLADLNVSESRTVRLIYFLPNDRPFRADVVQRMKDEIRILQAFFGEQMQVHGYGDGTFRFETDEQSEPMVYRMDGQHPDSHYLDDTQNTVLREVEQMFDLQANIYLVVVDNSINAIGQGSRRVGGSGGRLGKNSGYAFVSSKFSWALVAHELGHALGLHHDFSDDAYIMSYGWRPDRLSACHTEFLSVHPYLNPNTPIEKTPPPTIELVPPHASGRGTSASVQLKVRDSGGVHQVLLTNSGSTRRACRGLTGEKDAVVEFYYYDVIPPDGVTSLPNPAAHRIAVNAVDLGGNVSKASFVLDVSKWPPPQPQMLEKISGDEQQGPAGVQLDEPFVISVLDQNGSAIAGGAVVTFSVIAGGGTLSVETATADASGQAATRLTLGSDPGPNTIEVTVAGLEPVTFTATAIEQEITVGEQAMPHTLTKVSGDNQQGLAGEQLAAPFVVSVLDQNGSAIAGGAVVTFSVIAGGGTLSVETATADANGRARSTLTLGSEPGTNTVAATVAGLEPVTFTATAIEQTPHSLTKVSGDSQEGPASTQLAAPFVVSVLDQAGSPLAGVAVTFSVTAGGGMLSSTTDANPCTIESSTSSTTATTDANGQAATRLTLGSEPGTNTVTATVAGLESVTFTATAAEQAMPHSLTKVCGDSQEGTAGILLAEPLVVLVSDEDSAAIAGVVVSFTVTAGGGTLSDTTATTNANGRAATRLTLGSEPGTNTVSATVEGLESGTFTATGQESPFVSLFDLFGGGKRVALPDSPQLAQNAPNPFNSQTILSYFLPAAGPAHLTVFTLTGQRVAVLQQGLQQAGYHRLHWDGRDDVGRPVASGLYLYRLVTDEVVLTRKLVLLR